MNPPIRTAELEWSRRSAADQLDGVEWVDGGLDPDREHFQQVGERFHGPTMARYVPPKIARAAQSAQDEGHATLLEGMQLVLARVAWLVKTRKALWTEVSPVPRLLAALVEAHGIDQDVHRNDPERLARIVARLLVWRRRRGELEPTLALLDQAAGLVPDERLLAAGSDGPTPPELADEVLAGHPGDWWAARAKQGATMALRVEGGFLRFQDPEAPGFELLHEDVLAIADVDRPLARSVSRMLPGWITVRPVLNEVST